LVLSLISAVSDVRTTKIRNEIFIAGAVLGLTLNAAIGGWKGAAFSLLGMLIPILIFLPLSSSHFSLFGFHGIKIIGMGDVKLFAYIGALVCFPDIIRIIILTYVIGGVYSLILMIKKKILLKRLAYFFSWLGGYVKTSGNNPYISSIKIKFAPFTFFAVCAYYLFQHVVFK